MNLTEYPNELVCEAESSTPAITLPRGGARSKPSENAHTHLARAREILGIAE